MWGFNDKFPYAPRQYDEGQGRGLDYVIAGAGRRGIRVELALANFWEGMTVRARACWCRGCSINGVHAHEVSEVACYRYSHRNSCRHLGIDILMHHA